MKNWLALICMLGSLCGGVFTMYSTVSIGSNGLSSMAASLQNVSRVINTYYNRLNNARNTVMPAISNLQLYVNTTYTALNDSYGASQPNIENLMTTRMQVFIQQFYYADLYVSGSIADDLYQLRSQLQQSVDYLMMVYGMETSTYHGENGDSCSAQFADVFSNIPVRLAKFGQCLQTNVDIVPTVAASLKAILTLVLNDLRSLNKHLKICAATSTDCINEYFGSIFDELSYVNHELHLAQYRLGRYVNYVMWKNQVCGELVRYNVQDATQNVQQQVGQCMYPQTVG